MAHGFNSVVWQTRAVENGIELTCNRKDGKEGFPATLLPRNPTLPGLAESSGLPDDRIETRSLSHRHGLQFVTR